MLTAYIDIRETVCREVVSDWPNEIPEFFEDLDDQLDVIKVERLKNIHTTKRRER